MVEVGVNGIGGGGWRDFGVNEGGSKESNG